VALRQTTNATATNGVGGATNRVPARSRASAGRGFEQRFAAAGQFQAGTILKDDSGVRGSVPPGAAARMRRRPGFGPVTRPFAGRSARLVATAFLKTVRAAQVWVWRKPARDPSVGMTRHEPDDRAAN